MSRVLLGELIASAVRPLRADDAPTVATLHQQGIPTGFLSSLGPKFLTEFQDRLLFGTDICFFDMPFPMVDLLLEWRDTNKISEEAFNKVARENAVKLLGLV